MINFSGISGSALLGRALRLPLRLIPNTAEVRILQGPLRGRRWIANSSTHGCWLGSYEAAKQKKMIELVRPGMTCWDVGANVGFYTLLLSELVGNTGRVYAFEPLARNIELLHRHVRMNDRHNVRIFSCGLSDFDGESDFSPGPNPSMGHLTVKGQLKVMVSRADTLLHTGKVVVPHLIKIDVEGAETNVLQGALKVLEGRPIIFLATHGEVPHRACLDLLMSQGYEVQALGGGSPESADEIMAIGNNA